MDQLRPEELETQTSYDILAPIWDTRDTLRWKDQTWYDFLALIHPRGLVLDLGCGTGRDVHWFLKEKKKYVGIDISTGMLREATKKFTRPHAYSQPVFLRMDMSRLGFQKNSFNAFWATASLMHIPRNKLPALFAQLYEVLQPKAPGFISTPVGTFEGMWAPQGEEDKTLQVCWTEKQLKNELLLRGFIVHYIFSIDNMLLCLIQKP